MNNKSEIESRLMAVTGYTGSSDLAKIVTKGMPRQDTLGSDPKWMVARACMSPAEYITMGHDGKPWKFMRGKTDIAERSIATARNVVTRICGEMSLSCDWTVIK